VTRRRRRSLGLLLLGCYGWAALGLPALHQRHHRPDHVHEPDGAIRWLALGDARTAASHAEAHRSFDADLEALDLLDVAHAGIALVDCSLAAYTLAACDAGGTAHGFGDELLAREPHRHRPAPFDPRHGFGSAAHFGLVLLAPAPVLLPPPTQPLAPLDPLPLLAQPGIARAYALRIRGPPGRSI